MKVAREDPSSPPVKPVTLIPLPAWNGKKRTRKYDEI